MPEFLRLQHDVEAPVTCPACGSLVHTVQYAYRRDGRESHFYDCAACTFLFARPVLLGELTSRQMDGIDNAEMFNSRLMKQLYVHLFIKREIAKIKKHLPKPQPTLLDIGCGAGWTTRIYADHGFQVTGLEPSAARARHARETYGLTIIEDYLENLEVAARYDVIVFRHVIEHFADPVALIREARRLLAPGGVMLFVVPNINCLGRYLFDTAWAWILPWHCNFFTPKSLRTLLEGEGFECLAYYQTPSPLYFPGAFARKFNNPLTRWLVTRHKVAAMLATSPLAVAGSMLGMGDNLNAVVRVKSC